jgi:hypothetical protein
MSEVVSTQEAKPKSLTQQRESGAPVHAPRISPQTQVVSAHALA